MDKNLFHQDADTANGTIQMTSAEFEELSEGSNNPETLLDPDKLDLADDSMERLSKKPLRKYRFIRSIGRGGMKMVLQVKDMDATRDVAMAVLPDAAARPQSDIVRFIQEARITASLEHPNIVPVHDIGVDSTGAPYYTMKLLRGRTLASLIKMLGSGDPGFVAEYDTVRLLRIFLKICYGVAFAHSRGVIHLDLKPENIQIGDFGEVLIMDWGLAKVLESQGKAGKKDDSDTTLAHTDPHLPHYSGTTQDGIMKGTPGYMAPEQAAGMNSSKDTRTDIYSLGAILYSMMTWCDPLEQKEVMDRVAATLDNDIIPPRERTPDREIPAAIEAVIMKAMSLHPDDRYQSVRELRNEVNAFINGYATVAEKASFVKKSLLFVKRNIILAGFMAVVAFLIAAGATYMVQSQQRHKAAWKTVAEWKFAPGKSVTDCHVADQKNSQRRPARLTSSGGLVLNTGEWFWIDRQNRENIRLEMTAQMTDPKGAFDVVIRGHDIPVQGDMIPYGLSVRFANDGLMDMIVRRAVGRMPEPIAAIPTKIKPGDNRIVITLTGNRISVKYNDEPEPALSAEDLLLPVSENISGTAVRTRHTPLGVRRVKLNIQTHPESITPCLQGDILAAAGLYHRAYDQYMTVADLYPNNIFGDEALTEACRLAAFQMRNQELLEQARHNAMSRPAFSRKAKLQEYKALSLWFEGRYEDAFRIIDQILAANTKSNIMEQIMTLPHKKLSPQNCTNLLTRIASSLPRRRWLDLSGYGIEDLSPIRKMDLLWLDASRNQLKNKPEMEDTFMILIGNPELDLAAESAKKSK